MYLTLKQHDSFRTLLMGFEVPFRTYIAHKIVCSYDTQSKFVNTMTSKKTGLRHPTHLFCVEYCRRSVQRANCQNCTINS